MPKRKAETVENTEKVDNEILDTYQPADCFDKVKTRGRPKLKLNATGVRVIEALAAVQCTEEEIAACLHCTVETLHSPTNEETFLECYKKGFLQGKVSLRRYQFQLARKNPTMSIFLGKQYLGQTESEKKDDGGAKTALDELCAAIRSAGGKNGS